MDAIYTATKDGEIQVWDCLEKNFSNMLEEAHTSMKRNYLKSLGEISEVLVNEDEKLLVSCSHDKSIKIWNLQDSSLLREFKNVHPGKNSSLFLFQTL